MASSIKIIKGTTEVSLLDASGFYMMYDGWTTNPSEAEEIGVVTERIKCKLIASTDDNAASQLKILNRLLRDAYRYSLGDPIQTVPVYMEVRYEDETNPRYALIAGDQARFRKSYYSEPARANDLFMNIDLIISREDWRSHKPGLLPGRVSLITNPGGPNFLQNQFDYDVELTSTFGHVPESVSGGVIGGRGVNFGTPTPPCRNLIPNPSFEVNVTDGWTNNNFDAVTQDTTHRLYGKASCHLDENNCTGPQNEYFQSDMITDIYPNQWYVGSFYYISENFDADDYVTGLLHWYTSTDTYISGDAVSGPVGNQSTFIRLAVAGKAPATAAKVRFSVSAVCDGGDAFDIYVDGVQFEEGGEPTTFCDGRQPDCSWDGVPDNSQSVRRGTTQQSRGVQLAEARTNRVHDPVFLYGDLLNKWNVDSGTWWLDSDYAMFGTHSARCASATGSYLRTMAADDYTLGAGGDITLSGWIRRSAAPSASSVGIRIRDVTNAAWRGTAWATSACNGEWEYVSVSWNNSTTAGADIRVYLYDNETTGNSWFDGIQLESRTFPSPLIHADMGMGHSAVTAHDSETDRTRSKLNYSIECPDEEFSIGGWWRPTPTATELGGDGYIFNWQYDIYNRVAVLLSAACDVPMAYIGVDGTSDSLLAGSDCVANTLFHWEVTWDGSTFSFYINGVLVDSGSVSDTFDYPPNTLYLGTSNGTSSYGNGVLDDFYVLSRARTAAEVLDYYNSGKPFVGDPDLFMYLPFDGPQRTHITNFHETLGHEIDVIWNYDDSGGLFSSNYAFERDWQLFDQGVNVDTDDCVYFGSTGGPIHHIVMNMVGNGDLTTSTLQLSYWTGAAWTVLNMGDDFTILNASGTTDALLLQSALEADGEIVINIHPSDTAYDASSQALNGVTAYYYRLQETHTAPVYVTYPRHGLQPVYAPRTNELRIPATTIDHGDISPTCLLRLLAPYGGDDDEGFANISRILWGMKSRGLNLFQSYLNAGNQCNNHVWACTYDADTAATANGRAPGGYSANCTFAASSPIAKRVTYTGTDVLSDYVGDYRAFVLMQQTAGSVDDVTVMVRTYIGSTNAEDPHLDTEIMSPETVNGGIEAVDMGTINIPFAESHNVDDYTLQDLIFEIHVGRSDTASTAEIYGLFLLPLDEASAALDDTKSDTSGGSMALRGDECVEHDGGIVTRRTAKLGIVTPTQMYTKQGWDSGGAFLWFNQLDREARLYFLLLHYPSGGTWGTGPMIATLGCHVGAELELHHHYQFFRGND